MLKSFDELNKKIDSRLNRIRDLTNLLWRESQRDNLEIFESSVDDLDREVKKLLDLLNTDVQVNPKPTINDQGPPILGPD